MPDYDHVQRDQGRGVIKINSENETAIESMTFQQRCKNLFQSGKELVSNSLRNPNKTAEYLQGASGELTEKHMDLKKGLEVISDFFDAIAKPRVDDEMSSALRKYEAIGYTCEKKMNDGFTLRLVAASGLRDSSSPKDPIILYMNTSNTIRAVPENQFDPLSQATTQMCPFAFAKCTNVELTELGRIGDRNEAKSYYKKHRNLDGYLCKGCTKQSDVYFQQFQE